MVAVISTLKPLKGTDDLAQRNAVGSWKLIGSVILFGHEALPLLDEGVTVVEKVEHTEFGYPSVKSLFERALELTISDVLIYANADIILTDDVLWAIDAAMNKFDSFAMVGRRHDLDVTEPIHFNNNDWQKQLRQQVVKRGKLHRPTGIDYFIFTRDVPTKFELKPFNVGRPGWDNYTLKNMIKCTNVINATQAILALHQNHKEDSHKFGTPPTNYNLKLLGKGKEVSIADVKLIMDKELNING